MNCGGLCSRIHNCRRRNGEKVGAFSNFRLDNEEYFRYNIIEHMDDYKVKSIARKTIVRHAYYDLYEGAPINADGENEATTETNDLCQ